MTSQSRIDEEELEFDDDLSVYNGTPYTGVAFLEYPNKQLKREATFKDGFEEGLCREWYANGQLKTEWFAIHGRAAGKVTRWHENGKVQSVGEYENGVELRYEEWNDQGDLAASRQLDRSSELFRYLEKTRTA